jgi:hypothetical protein
MEGSQYAFYTPMTWGSNYNYSLYFGTRAGKSPANIAYSDGVRRGFRLRSPITTNTSEFAVVYSDGGSYGTVGNSSWSATSKTGVLPCFAFGTVDVSFNTKGADSATPETQTLAPGETATRPDDPTREGYEFKGWFTKDGTQDTDGDGSAGTDADWGEEFDFSTAVSADTTLYAKWEETTASYWLNHADCLNPEQDIIKTRPQIQADLDVLATGAADAAYADTLAEYQSYMNGADGTPATEVHLYTKIGSGTAADDYAEFRIVEIGSHKNSASDADGDGATITWQMTHLLPSAYQVNASKTNEGGWASTALSKQLKSTADGGTGEIYGLFKSALLDDIEPLSKSYLTSRTASDTASDASKLWLPSASELYGATGADTSDFSYYDAEGTQYAYYEGKGVGWNDNENECLALRTRSGGIPAGQTEASPSGEQYGSWWTRSTALFNEQTWMRVFNDGRIDHNYTDIKRGVSVCFAMKGTEPEPEPSAYFMATAALGATTLAKLGEGDLATVADAANNFRSEADVKADMAVLHGEKAANNQGEDKAAVEARWSDYMGSDTGGSSSSHDGWTSSTVHLYTRWNGDSKTASDEDGWVELRVVQVGAHDSDGSAVTFMAVHSLPTGKAVNGTSSSDATTSGGWEKSEMRTTVMKDYVQANLDEGFKSAVKTVSKKTVNTSDPSSDPTVSSTDDAVWLMSYKELTGTKQSFTGDEGEQYSWFSGKVTDPTGNNAAIANLCYTRSGSIPSSLTGYYAWLRSPCLYLKTYFMSASSTGNPYSNIYTHSKFGVCPALAM